MNAAVTTCYFAVKLGERRLCAGDANVYFKDTDNPSLFTREKAETWAEQFPGSVLEPRELCTCRCTRYTHSVVRGDNS